jgi:proteasome regulatory subunit
MTKNFQEVLLNDLVGLEKQTKILHDCLFLPIIEKELYNKLVKCPDKVKNRKHFLFYGPPGTGKTSLAKALASEYDVPYTFVQSTQFLNQFVGTGASIMRKLYSNQNGIVFIDEIDIIAKKRTGSDYSKTDDILVQLLMILDGATSNFNSSTIMATNKYELLDDALLSRIPKSNQLYFPMPDEKQRKNMIEKKLSYYNHKINAIDELVKKTNNYDGRNIEDLFSTAKNYALNSKRDYLVIEDFLIDLTSNK